MFSTVLPSYMRLRTPSGFRKPRGKPFHGPNDVGHLVAREKYLFDNLAVDRECERRRQEELIQLTVDAGTDCEHAPRFVTWLLGTKWIDRNDIAERVHSRELIKE